MPNAMRPPAKIQRILGNPNPTLERTHVGIYDYLDQLISLTLGQSVNITTILSGGAGITELTDDVIAGPGTGSQPATVIKLKNDVAMLGALLGTNIATPPAPGAGKTRLFSSASGYKSVASTGIVQTMATPIGFVASQWLRAMNANGSFTQGQPSFSDINGTVPNSQLATMPALTIKGNNTAGVASPLDLTATQVTAMLNVFTGALKGLVPLSGGGTINFLRADGTWASPGGGTVTSVTASPPLASSGGTTPNISHLGAIAAGAVAYPQSITFDAYGHAQSATPGSAPVTAVTASSPIVSSGGTTPNITHAAGGAGAITVSFPRQFDLDIGGHITSVSGGSDPGVESFQFGMKGLFALTGLVGGVWLACGHTNSTDNPAGQDFSTIALEWPVTFAMNTIAVQIHCPTNNNNGTMNVSVTRNGTVVLGPTSDYAAGVTGFKSLSGSFTMTPGTHKIGILLNGTTTNTGGLDTEVRISAVAWRQ